MHPSLLNKKQGAQEQSDIKKPEGVVSRDKAAESQYVQKILTSRGEGLSDVLHMKKSIEKNQVNFKTFMEAYEKKN